jgi:hypothetical protein
MKYYRIKKYFFILPIFILFIVHGIYGQDNSDSTIEEYFKERSVYNFAITPKYFWASVFGPGEDLVKYDGLTFQTYFVDEKSEGPLINYLTEKSDYNGYLKELINYNEDIWLFNFEPKNIIKIHNDTIMNYPLDKLFTEERTFMHHYNIDNFGNLSFLVYSPPLESDKRNGYSICTIERDSIFLIEVPSIIHNIEYFCSFDNKYYIISYNKKTAKLHIFNRNFIELKEYLLSDNYVYVGTKHDYYNNKLYLLNNHGDFYTIYGDSLELCKLDIYTNNICFDFLMYKDNLIFSDFKGIYYYDILNHHKSKLFNYPEKIGFLINLKIANNKLYGNYGIASDYTCKGSYTDGIEIINLEK